VSVTPRKLAGSEGVREIGDDPRRESISMGDLWAALGDGLDPTVTRVANSFSLLVTGVLTVAVQ
jgi:hypothetical protein